MRERRLRWGRVGIVAVALAAFSGCNTEPNPNFEQKLKDQYAASTGDPYAGLQNLPRQYRYVRAEPQMKQAAAAQEALSMRGNYDGLLAKLATEPEVPALRELMQSCQAAFAQASAFQGDGAAESQTLQATATAIFEKLNDCRDGAIAAEKAGDEFAQDRAHLLRRFASAGMTMLGAATIGHGEQAGLELWSRGDELAAKDKPEFKVNARMLLSN